MTTLEYCFESETATSEFGKRFGELIFDPLVIFLNGTLGAGKTLFVQAVAAGLQIDPETVQSPTFTLLIPHHGRMTLVHVDAYRIRSLDEAEQLGLDDWVDSGCVLMIEWAERVEPVLPNSDLTIEIEQAAEKTRNFKLTSTSAVGERLLQQTINLGLIPKGV